MKPLPIIKIGHPVLRKKAKSVTKAFLRQEYARVFAARMVMTMRAAGGVGLAANQAGASLRIMVLECQKNRRYPGREAFPLQIYINPKITYLSKEKVWDWEGCLSIPGYRGWVARAKYLILEAWDQDGNKIRKKFSGFEARVIQHEYHHLRGRVYMDSMPDLKKWFHVEAFNDQYQSAIRD